MRDPAQGRGFLRQGDRSPMSCYRLIDAEKAHHPVSQLARVLGVARAGYYAWACRPPSDRSRSDALLGEQIRQIHEGGGGGWGGGGWGGGWAWAWASMSAANASPASCAS